MTWLPLSAPFDRDTTRIAGIMSQVLFALVPATLWGLLLFGLPAVFLFTLTVVSALFWEALAVWLSGKSARRALADYSALLTGWLLALSLPPWAPWWIGVFGAFIAIVIGKHVYGGLGQNLFNPAMLARVALLIAFPVEMTTWIDPQPGWLDAPWDWQRAWAIVSGTVSLDGYTGASLLGHVKTEFSRGLSLSEAYASFGHDAFAVFIGYTRGSLGETSSVAFLAGGLWLLYKKVITWHIPASFLATVIFLAALFHGLDAAHYPDASFHLGSGALMLTAFFIATDYVTSPHSPFGQVLFGIGLGVILFVIRTFGAYPEGAAFAILLMNALTPVIDHYVRPRIYGRDRRGRPLELEGGE